MESPVENDIVQSIFESHAEIRPNGDSFLRGRSLLNLLKLSGIQRNDIRLAASFEALEQLGSSGAELSLSDFRNVIHSSESLVTRALTQQLVIPDFESFSTQLKSMFDESLANTSGHVATYIPPLAKADPRKFAVALCTIDGQVCLFGDYRDVYTIQSCSKPITYAIAAAENGLDACHHHVGREPSGVSFNKLILKEIKPSEALKRKMAECGNDSGTDDGATQRADLAPRKRQRDEFFDVPLMTAIPHNPMINAGSIMCCSLIARDLTLGDRVQHILDIWKRLTIGPVQVDAAVFLGERATATRNNCLAYMMEEAHAFPQRSDLQSTLELYFQACSISMDTYQLSIVAASLAKGGVNPFTGDHVFEEGPVRAALSLMLSCGMYDYSGEWAFRVGLPAKSGVSGCIIVVLPNVGGLAVWSPALDDLGNSVRGVDFCKKLIEKYKFHHLESSSTVSGKVDPTAHVNQRKDEMVVQLLFSASRGDIHHIRSLLGAGCDVNCADYDKRTALHVAAADGQVATVEFLLQQGANPHLLDRWNGSPLDDAKRVGNDRIVRMIEAALIGLSPVISRKVVESMNGNGKSISAL